MSLGPELSSENCFQIQGGYPEHDTGGAAAGQDSFFLMLDMVGQGYGASVKKNLLSR